MHYDMQGGENQWTCYPTWSVKEWLPDSDHILESTLTYLQNTQDREADF